MSQTRLCEPSCEPETPLSDSGRRFGSCAGVSLLAALLTAVFLAPWWNRYLGLSLDGYLPMYGQMILDGQVPYRDFFLHLPPLNPLLDAALQWLFGPRLVAMRMAGAIERLAMAGLLAFWLRRHFRPVPALGASLVAVWLSSGCDTEILDLYNHHSLFFGLGSGLAAALALRGGHPRRLEIAAGWLAGLAFWTKQTSGLGATIAVPAAWVLLALADSADRHAGTGRLFRFALGWGLCALPLVAWLARRQALSPFIQQVFLDAANSKGSPLHLVLRPWVDPFHLGRLAWSAGLAIVLVGLVLGTLRLHAASAGKPAPGSRGLGWLVLGVLAALGSIHLQLWTWAGIPALLALAATGVFLSTYGTLVLFGQQAWLLFRRPPDDRHRELLLFTTVALVLGATFALSFPADNICATPGLALWVAFVWDAQPRHPRCAALRRLIPLFAAGTTLAAMSVQWVRPFEFASWREPPIAAAQRRSSLDKLAGLRLSAQTCAATEAIVANVQQAAAPGEAIFTYPYYPLFNWLAERPPATFAILHWFDVTPDRIVAADLERLRQAPPPAVVAQWLEPDNMDLHERYFRGGNESALRRMQAELQAMLARDYVRLGAWKPSGLHVPLELWVRADRAPAGAGASAGTNGSP